MKTVSFSWDIYRWSHHGTNQLFHVACSRGDLQAFDRCARLRWPCSLPDGWKPITRSGRPVPPAATARDTFAARAGVRRPVTSWPGSRCNREPSCRPAADCAGCRQRRCCRLPDRAPPRREAERHCGSRLFTRRRAFSMSGLAETVCWPHFDNTWASPIGWQSFLNRCERHSAPSLCYTFALEERTG